MDSHVMSVFVIQSLVTAVVLTFCIGMLARGADPGVYLPVLTGITGFWFPSPLQHHQLPQQQQEQEQPWSRGSTSRIYDSDAGQEAAPEVRIICDPACAQT